MRRLNKLNVGLVLSILLFLLLGYWIVKPKLVDQPPYLSFSADADGTRAWKELLSSKQPSVKEWRLDWKNLPNERSMLLVAIEPTAVTKADREQLLNWVRKGNDFILFDRQPVGWTQWSIEDVANAAKKDEVSTVDNRLNEIMTITTGQEFPGTPGILRGEVDTSFRLKSDGQGNGLFADERGILARRLEVGAGSITVVLTPNWMQNETINKESHFELIWPLFAKSWGAVWVDETHHGLGTKPGLLAIYPTWLVLASVQLALALLLWLWLRGKRFGPVHTPRAWTVRRGDETLQALAAWYERLGYREEALAHQQQLLRQLLAQRWGLSPNASREEAAQAARGRWPEAQVAQLARLLVDVPRAEDGGSDDAPRAAKQRGLSAKEFVERTREMGDMIAYLEKE
ncbi:DUF4350 domain-containing protein [Paenibacillus sp. SYP-B3998]|uniref:DUF4350 domain-containing protein n=1 Tax=Paenibacillus sp. SYP-B3998 TaxID=2678564 RepID=A0A6G4A4K3_9BACL|nr:DUF4350 domain-containing protein [Paenibacillus sp. SYP-B3998]NEW09218.1 DUF4350 domain-containing protein [Paenibacillus sp. SYP-B3998]